MTGSLSIVVQGDIRPETAAALRAARANYPGAELIFSTWKGASPLPEFDLCDRVLHSDDPGPLPTDGPMRNLRRQVISTMAGLEACTREVAVKCRSDLQLTSDGLHRFTVSLEPEKIAVWRNFTSCPFKTKRLFHASDLLQLATPDLLRLYWSTEVPESIASSRLVPEQYLLLRYLASKGEIQEPFENYLPPTFANLHLHNLLFARYLRVMPRGLALLPERLRQYDEVYQRDADFSGTLRETRWMWLAMRLYPFKAAARQWVCQRRARRAAPRGVSQPAA